MPENRFYVDTALNRGEEISLVGQEFHHLAKVMRAHANDRVELVNGRGVLAKGRIATIEKRDAHLLVEEQTVYPPTPFTCILAQALPRLNRLEIILEKGTELGMDALWVFPGDFSEKKSITEQQMRRIRALTIAAMKQCGRLYLPEVHFKPPLSQWKKQEYPLFFGDLNPEAPPLGTVLKASHGLIFCVGPEKGFSEKEESVLKKLGAKGVKLHQNILRTDTAPLAALSIIQHQALIT